MSFNIDIVSFKGNIFSGEVDQVVLPTIDGEVTILTNHMAYVAPLTIGEVAVKSKQGLVIYSIGKGIFSIINNNASLLIEDVQSADEITETKVLEAKQKAEEIIAKGVQGPDLEKALYSLRKSLIDLKISRKKPTPTL